jgi:uncharacterized membrane protein (DUF106 family)
MGFFSFLDPALNSVLGPLLNLPPVWAVVIMSFLISLLIVIIYKYTTNQSLMKQLKLEIKEFQKQMKELKKEPEKAMAIQKKAMQTNMKYMMHSMRATLFTLIPIIILFGWLQAHLAFVPLMPGEEFNVYVNFEDGAEGNISISVPEGIELLSADTKVVENGQVVFRMKGEAGTYSSPPLEFNFDSESHSKDVIITNEKMYETPESRIKGDSVKSIVLGNKKQVMFDLFGWKMGWLATYIIFALVFSMILRKLLKVY